jgi:hypothetical protein
MYTLCQNNECVDAQLTLTYRLSAVLRAKKQERFLGFSIQVLHDHGRLIFTVEEAVLNLWINFHL